MQQYKFLQKRKLKEVTVLKQKIAIQSEFSGQTSGKDATGYIQTCVTLNDFCLYLLQRENFSFSGPQVKNFLKGNSKTSKLFSVSILLMGYPINIGADFSYSWSLQQSNIFASNVKGIQESVSATLSVNAYGEINLIGIIKIQAGVSGNIFKGAIIAAVRFGYDIKKVTIDFKLEVLTMDVYASYCYMKISIARRCIGRRWWKICWWFPSISYSDWKDIYRKSFALVKITELKRLFELKSKCY